MFVFNEEKKILIGIRRYGELNGEQLVELFMLKPLFCHLNFIKKFPLSFPIIMIPIFRIYDWVSYYVGLKRKLLFMKNADCVILEESLKGVSKTLRNPFSS